MSTARFDHHQQQRSSDQQASAGANNGCAQPNRQAAQHGRRQEPAGVRRHERSANFEEHDGQDKTIGRQSSPQFWMPERRADPRFAR